ncbi:MAG: flippase-like domain-containing protein [Muribaculaceae bacterium]|nr:flippase-like domain-containing protein [Muribaculaceae bacterium]
MNQHVKLLLKVMLPVAIGIGVVAWLMMRDFDIDTWRSINWSTGTIGCVVLALLFTLGRETGLAWRFRALSDRRLNWKQSFKVTMLCEFVSAITPSTAGGSAVSMVFMKREGIEAGRGTALTMTTIFLDELFFVVLCPIIFLLEPSSRLFGFGDGGETAFSLGFKGAFWIVWGIVCIWTIILFTGIFIKPEFVGGLLVKLFRLKWLHRWSSAVEKIAEDMAVTGKDLKHRPAGWWAEAVGATFLSWISRFLVVNAIFLGFAPWSDQLLVFCRQFVVWTLLTVSPTPGGSGVSEWLFTTYYGDMLGSAGIALIIAIIWRLISYYLYLGIGAVMVPAWLKGLKIKKHHDNE